MQHCGPETLPFLKKKALEETPPSSEGLGSPLSGAVPAALL